MRVRQVIRGNGVDLAVDGPHRIFDCAVLKGLDVRHVYGRIQGGLLCEQGGADDLYLVIGIGSTAHECERGLTSHQSYLDTSAVDQEFILQEQVHVETAHDVDDTTPDDVRSPSHEPCISQGPFVDLHGIHASGVVFLPQLTHQLRCLGICAVTQQRLDVGAMRIRVSRRGHERTVQVDVDLTKELMQPVIHRTHGIGQVEVVLVGSGHLHLYV